MLPLILSCCPTCCSKVSRVTCEQGMQASFSPLGQSICSSSLSHVPRTSAIQLCTGYAGECHSMRDAAGKLCIPASCVRLIA